MLLYLGLPPPPQGLPRTLGLHFFSSLTLVGYLANSPTKAFLCGPVGHVNQVCEKNNKSPARPPLCPFELAYRLPQLLLMEAKRLQNLPEA